MTTEPTTEERITVIPEVTISLKSKQARERAFELLDELTPKLEELQEAAITVRDDVDAILVALYPIFGVPVSDEGLDLAFKAAGFEELWGRCRRIGDMFGDESREGMSITGLQNHEIARGGERDFPAGTVATIPTGDEGKPVTVRVEHGPSHPLADGGYVVKDVESGREYICSHDKIKAGVETMPAPDGEDAGVILDGKGEPVLDGRGEPILDGASTD